MTIPATARFAVRATTASTSTTSVATPGDRRRHSGAQRGGADRTMPRVGHGGRACPGARRRRRARRGGLRRLHRPHRGDRAQLRPHGDRLRGPQRRGRSGARRGRRCWHSTRAGSPSPTPIRWSARSGLVAQLALDCDVVCGTIVAWTTGASTASRLRGHFARTYHDVDGHRHIHGANLGMSADAYRRVGGFERLENSEDVAIVGALESVGARIAWSAAPARRHQRATRLPGHGRIRRDARAPSHRLSGSPATLVP